MSWTKENQNKFPESWSKVKIALQKSAEETPIAGWNKGKTKKDFPNLSNSGVKVGNIPFNKGKKLSEIHKENMRGKRKPFSLESRRNMSGRVPWNKKYFGEIIIDPWKLLFSTPEYKRFRFEMFKRDNFKCTICGIHKEIQLDHIKPKSLFPQLVMAEWNVRTLCLECHKKTDTWGMSGKTKKAKFLAKLEIDENPIESVSFIGIHQISKTKK